jgi:DinB family protein
MPFAYYARLTRAQQAIYRTSDAIADVRLPQPADLQPLVAAVETALGSENRATTQATTERLLHALTAALGIPRVTVEVLSARPHARWGELHGLYTADGRRPPRIQLWMRTAKQRRVVAFRTYLRTLLHEFGHHVDYTYLRLPDSLHTDGFYKRESSLFHQLVPPRGDASMPTMEEVAKQSLRQRLERMAKTPDDLAAAIRGKAASALSRRPDDKNWAPTEVVCHLRDTEELFMNRFELILSTDGPKLALDPSTPDRWAEDRQYLRNDAGQALEAFRRRREESLIFLGKLTPEQYQRSGMHATRGRLTIDDFVTLMAWHDENHLDQLRRALDGKP